MRNIEITREEGGDSMKKFQKRRNISDKGILLVAAFMFSMFSFTGCSRGPSTENDNQQAESIQVTESVLSDEAAMLTESSLADADQEKMTTAELLSETADGDVIAIKEDVFATMCDDIYLNTKGYLGKTIKIEGMAEETLDETYKETIYSVYRTSSGCCGNDGWSGFEYVYEGEMPKDNDWIEVVGVLESYELDGQEYLRLRAESVTVKDQRGAEFVQN